MNTRDEQVRPDRQDHTIISSRRILTPFAYRARRSYHSALLLKGWNVILNQRRTIVRTPVLLILLVCPLSCSQGSRRQKDAGPTSQTRNAAAGAKPSCVEPISESQLLAHIAILAHDQLEGRGTGSEGIDLAAGYVAGQLAVSGVEPGGDGKSYFQKFEIPGDARISPTTTLGFSGVRRKPELDADFIPLARSAEGKFDAPLVFAGYGLTDADRKHDDYEGLDVKGKAVLVFRGQPPQLNSESQPRERTLFDRKFERAKELGASAILFVNTAPTAEETEKLIPFGRRGRVADVPAVHISRALADEVLTAAGQPSLSSLQETIDKGENVPVSLAGVTVSGTVAIQRDIWPSRNVIGLVPGNGPQADQYVVLGAHYDHLGVREGQIHNGADDNASGTAGVIEICEAIARNPNRNRSLLCMAFTGEEIGLLGSKHYTEKSTVPMKSIIAMVNLDMIGRWTPNVEENELAIQGLGTGDSFQEIVDRHTSRAGINFLPDPSAKGPSDHASFYEAEVPSLFFFTGVHGDYHRPGDDVEKINASGAARIATLVAGITLDLINCEQPPKFTKVDKPARIFRGPPPSPVIMGIVPDMEADAATPDWLIADVLPNGGAANAGMKAGDRILSLDGTPISKLADYYKATVDKKAGDVVSVVVRRGSEEITLRVELAARPGQ